MNKIIFLSLSLIVAIGGTSVKGENTVYRGAFRVNSSVTSGTESVEEIAGNAEKVGLDFVVMSDQMLVKAEYGIPPFRNILKLSIRRPDAVSYGLDKYFGLIKSADAKRDIVMIYGLDVAPGYFWTGSIFKKNLINRQFSEQLTVFGNEDPDFYRNLPVIHNDLPEKNVIKIILKSWPLVISIFGMLVFSSAFIAYYSDRQGKKYYRRGRFKISVGIIFIITGVLWTLDNRPMTRDLGIDIYSFQGNLPYQNLIDYVNENGGKHTGVIWSAPEARTTNLIRRIPLHTEPYLSSVLSSMNHNGLAGIYGDAITAHLPGKEWDKMLLEHCQGTRKKLPVIVGELDYHGKTDRPIDLIQTSVFCEKTNSKPERRNKIIESILAGKSYAVFKGAKSEIVLIEVKLSSGDKKAELGETLEVGGDKITLDIRGTLSSPKEESLDFALVMNGNLLCGKQIKASAGKFEISETFEADPGLKNKQYVRFYIRSGSSGWLLANPIFIKKNR